MGTLEGQRVVLVGAGSGIGLAVARAALGLGARVVVMDVSSEKLDAAQRELPHLTTAVVDVTRESSVAAAFDGLTTIDHVYVSAGSTRLGGILDAPVDEQLPPLVLRLWGNVFVTRAATKKIRAGGSLTFTGGISSDRPVPGAWVSSVATAAAEQLARAMALELAPVRCNAVAPGWTDTPMWDAILGAQKASTFASIAAKLPTRRLVRAEEVAAGVIFLMANGSMTGEVLHIDGGGRLV